MSGTGSSDDLAGTAAATVTPANIMALSTAFWNSQALLTANRIGIFEALAKQPMSASQLAAKLQLAERQLRLLLDACAALDLLTVNEGRFSNSPNSAAFLVSGQPGYLGNAIRYSDNLYATWGQLESCLRNGEPPMATADYTGQAPVLTRDFVYGMHDRAMGIGRVLVELVDLGESTQLLDVGGGPGTYSSLFAQRLPDLHCVVLDLPGVVQHANDIIAGFGVSERVTTLAGDFKTTPFPEDNDVVVISGVVHRELEAQCRALIQRAADSLRSGGLLVVSDVFADANHASSFAALFGVNMMLTAESGGVHVDETFAQWMREANFEVEQVTPFPPPMPHSVIVGRYTG